MFDEIREASGAQGDEGLISPAGEDAADALQQVRGGVNLRGGDTQARGEIDLIEGDAGACQGRAEVGVDFVPGFRRRLFGRAVDDDADALSRLPAPPEEIRQPGTEAGERCLVIELGEEAGFFRVPREALLQKGETEG
ncbi:MAG: hypothetical protein A4E73_03306 [Syntrophaceae bacterium PtaU1.Bin231]|nr:MAG: hypothetical protein A4E73_03306 [Syntrophaceae bacterium PtaU1.Bin231]